MATDHFKRHSYQKGRPDWNFNILFDGQPQVARLAAKYSKCLDSPVLYKPVPSRWLHMTILRVGYFSDFSGEEMSAVGKLLKHRLATMKLPELILGPWWLWTGGGPVLHVTPEPYMAYIQEAALDALREVVDSARLPKLRPFIPHVTLAYNRDYGSAQERKLRERLSKDPFEPVSFRAKVLSSIEQEQKPPLYRWRVVENIPIGQA